MRYQQCKKAELVTFAANRGLQVTSAFQKGPYVRDYRAALEQADQDATFRFLELPAELRNWIYEDLLTLRNSFSCFPQILRTSRAVSTEATGILYAENYIDVKIYPDGVYAHGRRCGSYSPEHLRMSGTSNMDFTTILWPAFLLRARFMRVIVPDKSWSQLWTWDRREECVANTLYSLCQMLGRGDNLRSLRLEMQPDTTSTFESMQFLLDPLRLLVGVQLDLVDSTNMSIANFYSCFDALPVVPTGALARMKIIYECIRLASSLEGLPHTLAAGHGNCWSAYRLLRATVSSAQGWTGGHDYTLPIWLNAFRAAAQHLRKCMEARKVWRIQIDPALLLRAYALLRFDVDLIRHVPGDETA